MSKRLLMIRYGEMMLKGVNRARFVRILEERLATLTSAHPSLTAEHEFGRAYLDVSALPEPQHAELGQQIARWFGVHSVSPVRRTALDVPQISEAATELLRSAQLPAQHSFKVDVRRVYKPFPLTSTELTQHIGGVLLARFETLRVDVRNPQTTLHVEVREQGAFLFIETWRGSGGFPAGSNGRALALLSGGIDSPVAIWMAMRKGLYVEAIHFHSIPFTSEEAKQKVIRLAAQLAESSGAMRLHLVPFAEVQELLRRRIPQNLWVTAMRRAMLRIAQEVAVSEQFPVLVSGDSLGQVASQTLSGLVAADDAVTIPVLRPLLAFDKQEIIEQAATIGTLALSELPFADCCTLFVPKNPSTNPNLNVLRESEARLKSLPAALARAFAGTERLDLRADTVLKREFQGLL
jgi:thiamine biosynthesis protein ThiI